MSEQLKDEEELTDDVKWVSGRGNGMCIDLLLRELLANKFIGADHIG